MTIDICGRCWSEARSRVPTLWLCRCRGSEWTARRSGRNFFGLHATFRPLVREQEAGEERPHGCG